MKARIGWTVALLVLVASSSSEAGLFKRSPRKYTPPKAVNLTTQGGDETHKFLHAADVRGGPARYHRPGWGALWKQSLEPLPLRLSHSVDF